MPEFSSLSFTKGFRSQTQPHHAMGANRPPEQLTVVARCESAPAMRCGEQHGNSAGNRLTVLCWRRKMSVRIGSPMQLQCKASLDQAPKDVCENQQPDAAAVQGLSG